MARTTIDMKGHQQHDMVWFSLHGKNPKDPAASGFKPIRVLNNDFLLKGSIQQKNGYKIIYGYHVGKTLQDRMWYYSGSEACWRAFTGYRDNFCAWMKGAEYSKYAPGGYIFGYCQLNCVNCS